MSSACVVRGEIPAEEFALYEALSSLPGVEFEVERVVQSGDEAAMPLMWIRNADREAITTAFENDPSIRDLTLLSSFDNELGQNDENDGATPMTKTTTTAILTRTMDSTTTEP